MSKRQINRKKVTQFLLIFTFREEFILTKEGAFWLQGVINSREATKKYMGELMEDKGHVNKICFMKTHVRGTLHLWC